VLHRKLALIDSGALDGRFVNAQAIFADTDDAAEGGTDPLSPVAPETGAPGADDNPLASGAAVAVHDDDDEAASRAATKLGGSGKAATMGATNKLMDHDLFVAKTDIPRPEGFWAKATADIDRDFWQLILSYDETMVESLYSSFDFRNMGLHPFFLFFKLALVLPVVFMEPNTVEQLAVAAVAEGLQLVFLLNAAAFLNPWVDFIGKAGSMHQLLQLAWMALHRVTVYDQPDSAGFGPVMVTTTTVYFLILLVVFLKVVVGPLVAGFFKRRKALQELQETSDERIFQPDEAFADPAVAWAEFLMGLVVDGTAVAKSAAPVPPESPALGPSSPPTVVQVRSGQAEEAVVDDGGATPTRQLDESATAPAEGEP